VAKSAPISAGVLLCRAHQGHWQFLLAHPGGPFFARKDDGIWTLPKGLIDPDEDALCAAQREFREETGFALPDGPFQALGEIVQKGGKRVLAWAVVGDAELTRFVSNTFELEWPPRSGKLRSFPEIDRVGFFDYATACSKILSAQSEFLERARSWLASRA
jgi:predicted NUDIX family NTP pyrophosphohydrolase